MKCLKHEGGGRYTFIDATFWDIVKFVVMNFLAGCPKKEEYRNE